jgi:ATP synthase protein I
MSEKQGGPGDSLGGGSFEERLRAARAKQGAGAPPRQAGDEPSGWSTSAWGIGLRVGVELVSALVVAVAIGWGLDRLFGTRPFLLILFVPLGGAAGILNVWRMFAPPRRGPGENRGGG